MFPCWDQQHQNIRQKLLFSLTCTCSKRKGTHSYGPLQTFISIEECLNCLKLSTVILSSVMVLESLITLVPASSSVGYKSPAQPICFQRITSRLLLVAAPLISELNSSTSPGEAIPKTVWGKIECLYIGDSRFPVINQFSFPFHFTEDFLHVSAVTQSSF